MVEFNSIYVIVHTVSQVDLCFLFFFLRRSYTFIDFSSLEQSSLFPVCHYKVILQSF